MKREQRKEESGFRFRENEPDVDSSHLLSFPSHLAKTLRSWTSQVMSAQVQKLLCAWPLTLSELL